MYQKCKPNSEPPRIFLSFLGATSRSNWGALIYYKFCEIEHLNPYFFPIGFQETHNAAELNIQAKQRAIDLLKNGGALIIFPVRMTRLRSTYIVIWYTSTMQTPLLATKLYTPISHPTAIVRHELLARLSSGLTARATLIVAPAGFGKSTLISQWVNTLECSAAWLTLDDADNEPSRFLTYFIAAIREVYPHLGEQALTLLHSLEPPPIETVLTTLINELTQHSELLLLVLDDYHLIDKAAVHEMLDFLLAHAPPHLHVVIACRQEPPLSLARLRVHGEVQEVTIDALRFSTAEISAFFDATLHLSLEPAIVTMLEERTAGWAAVLRLASMVLQSIGATPSAEQIATHLTNFRGDDRPIFDYLTAEVFTQLCTEQQSFLIQTVLLDRLCGELCDAVTAGTNGQQKLEALAKENLFLVPLDNERLWYRYHGLFADFLRHRLEQLDPDEINTLHRRAATWYAEHDLPEDAINHALIAQDTERAARLIEANAMRMARTNDVAALVKGLTALPHSMCEASPILAFAQAGIALIQAQFEQADHWLKIAEQALTHLPTDAALPLDAATIQGYLNAIRSTVAVNFRGQTEEIIAVSQRALIKLPSDETFLRGAVALNLGDAYVRQHEATLAEQALAEAVELTSQANSLTLQLTALGSQGALYENLGHLPKAAAIYRCAIRKGQEWGKRTSESHPATGKAYAKYSRILYQWNQLEEAEAHAREAVACSQRWGHTRHIMDGYLELIKALYVQGKHDEVDRFFASARLLAKETWTSATQQGTPTDAADELLADVELLQWRLWNHQGRQQDVADQLSAHESSARTTERTVACIRLALAQQQWTIAETLLAQLQQKTNKRIHYIEQIELLLLRAQLYHHQNKLNQALRALHDAFVMGESSGYFRVFLDEGPPILYLLQMIIGQENTPPYVHTLLNSFTTMHATSNVSTPTQMTPLTSPGHPAPLAESLSARELDVLRLMADDLTYQAIGDRLFISLNTVRAHAKHIYGKLNVNRRNQAVQRAQELGLL
ncbi:LuxR C-terminal-related transcriptional regulator [Chloroflexi bacterium TSY]|nr:LuxR C-terminal-related transcriptional regulator [Chloroflexi bacterium TSY]